MARKPPTRSPELAPGDLALIQAFVATRTLRPGPDELSTPGALSDWFATRGVLPQGTELGEADLRRALAVRAGFRALIETHNLGKLDVQAIENMDEAVRGARSQVRIERSGVPRVALGARNFDEALGTLTGLFLTAQREGLWVRLKDCLNGSCRAVFYDSSKNKTRKYCSKLCGDVVRARAFRKRPKNRRGKGRGGVW